MKPACPVCLVLWLAIGLFAGLVVYNHLRRARE
jgi:hypothetical protein